MTHAKLLLAAVVLLPRLLLACEAALEGGTPFGGLCGLVSGRCTHGSRIAVLSAFPYEQHTLRQSAEVTETFNLLDRSLLAARLGGKQVLLRLTGIGLVNATETTEALVTQFNVSAIVFSGVAGSAQRIGDVMVPTRWTDAASGRSFDVTPAFLAAAKRVAAHPPRLGHCTPNPPEPPGPELCLPYAPSVIVGGAGSSSDPFGGAPLACDPTNTGRYQDVFGCEPLFAPQGMGAPQGMQPTPPEDPTLDAVDMETAAVAEVAAAHGIPFIAVRAASDGAGDPLGLPPESFQQFFIYYRLASDNAAAVTIKLLSKLPVRRVGRSRPAVACAFEPAAAPECAGVAASRRIARLVAAGCTPRAKLGKGNARADHLAASRWRRAAMLVESSQLPACCAEGLTRRLQAAVDAVSTDVQSRSPW